MARRVSPLSRPGYLAETAVDPLADPDGAASRLWTCPRCGHRFTSPNMAHSCSRYTLDEAFAKSEPGVRAAFDRYVEILERCGPVVVIPQKTRIAIMVQVRFAGATVLRDRVRINFALTRRVDHPAAYRIEEIVPGWFAHRFDVRDPAEVDALGIEELACEAYRTHGMRGSLGRLRAGAGAGGY